MSGKLTLGNILLSHLRVSLVSNPSGVDPQKNIRGLGYSGWAPQGLWAEGCEIDLPVTTGVVVLVIGVLVVAIVVIGVVVIVVVVADLSSTLLILSYREESLCRKKTYY